MSDHPISFKASLAGALAKTVKTECDIPNSTAKKWIEKGKVWVNETCQTSAGFRVHPGDTIEYRPRSRKPRSGPIVKIVFEDQHVVVIDKPRGVMSVPYAQDDHDTAMDLLRDTWRYEGREDPRRPLHVIHRIDKETSGLLCFALTKHAERTLGLQLRDHTMHRQYVCVVHGIAKSGKYESNLVANRGDGFRGSTRDLNRGKRAVTQTTLLSASKKASLLDVRLETGKTHQIRIHLSEAGHPLVGEKVYIRDFKDKGRTLIPSPRLMLHAYRLNFIHPSTGELVKTEASPPADFIEVAQGLGVPPS